MLDLCHPSDTATLKQHLKERTLSMNELQKELKFLIKEIGLYDDWENFFMGLINIRDRESLETTDSSDSPDCDIEGTLNKLKSLLSEPEPFKTNSAEETETNFTEDVSKSFKEEQQEELGSSSGREAWEEDTKISGRITDILPLVVTDLSLFDFTKGQVEPTDFVNFLEDDIFYNKICTRNTVSGIDALLDIFEIPEENSIFFEEAVKSLRSSLDNLGSFDDIKILKDIMKDIEKIVSLSPFYQSKYLRPPFLEDTLKIGCYKTNMRSEEKAQEILDLIRVIDSELPDLPVSAEVEMVQCLIPALTPIRNYIDSIHLIYRRISYSFILRHLNALEIIFKTYCKHQTSITSMKQEDISLEYKKIADSIALLKEIDKNMCLNSESDSD